MYKKTNYKSYSTICWIDIIYIKFYYFNSRESSLITLLLPSLNPLSITSQLWMETILVEKLCRGHRCVCFVWWRPPTMWWWWLRQTDLVIYLHIKYIYIYISSCLSKISTANLLSSVSVVDIIFFSMHFLLNLFITNKKRVECPSLWFYGFIILYWILWSFKNWVIGGQITKSIIVIKILTCLCNFSCMSVCNTLPKSWLLLLYFILTPITIF